tara:strand:+ start:252 stop:437 length:186 start_codon:yes stop_codon:yes gene_type:complete
MKKIIELSIKLLSIFIPFIIGGLIMGLNIWQSLICGFILVFLLTSIMFLLGKFKKKGNGTE